ncbi:MFS transporter [Lacticaseibacillus hulanensis]|uniref:MFS transporter n=1 Tax=Lacticaseibacillus hulanensis TaxID=2493111 RepID=UPI000FD92966|nr:MFS transporter [Lacticaseibacillus hulanensis]
MAQKEFKLKWLLAGSLITNIGGTFIWPLTTIYVHEYLHMPLTVAGTVIFLNCMASLCGNTVGGYLFDHWKPVSTLLCGISIDIVAAGLLIFFHAWPMYPVLLTLMGLGGGMTFTSINGYATKVPGHAPSYAFNFLYFTSSLGVAGGTLVVGNVLAAGIDWVFVCATSIYLLFAIIVLTFYRGRSLRQGESETAVASTGKRGRIRPEVLTVLVVVFIIWVFYEQWDSNLSSYMLSLGLTVREYSSVWTINAVVILLVQPLVTRADDWLTRHLTLRLCTGLGLFAISFATLLFARSYLQFALAMVILSLGEVTAMPAMSTYINLFATTATRGRYQGLVQAGASAGRAVGPLMGAFIIEGLSYQVLFMLAVSGLVAALLLFAVVSQRGNRSQDAA